MVALSLWNVVRCSDFVTPMDGSLVIMEGSSLLGFCYPQWMVALLLWMVVHFSYFVTPMDSSLVIMEGSSFLRFCYSIEWWACHDER